MSNTTNSQLNPHELEPDDEQESSRGSHGHGWYARKTAETRAWLAQMRPDENGQLPGYDWSRRRRRRSSRRHSTPMSRLWRRFRDWLYHISSPLP